jgi:DNA-binding MarR family transcriptional regulator
VASPNSQTKLLDTRLATDQFVNEAVSQKLPGADVEAMALCFGIIRAADRMQQDFEVNVQRPQGMTWAGFRTMFALGTFGPMRPLELARLNSVSQASISSVINTLRRAGVVVTEPSTDDARSVIVSLTAAGRERFETLFWYNNARERQWASALSAKERGTLIRLLTKVRDFDLPPVDRPGAEAAV